MKKSGLVASLLASVACVPPASVSTAEAFRLAPTVERGQVNSGSIRGRPAGFERDHDGAAMGW